MTDFTKMTRLCDVADVAEAVRTYFKRDRLPEDYSDIVKRAERWLNEEGDCCIASCHESRTGRALFTRREAGRLAVYER